MTTAATLARRAALAPMLVLALLAGCSNQELYSQLSERQANEMVAVLRSAGIEAEKKSQEGSFSVLDVEERLLAGGAHAQCAGLSARKLRLHGQGVQARRLRVFAARGARPPDARHVAGDLQHHRQHRRRGHGARAPGGARAQPAARQAAACRGRRCSSSTGPNATCRAQVTQIKALVVNSIEGLSYDNVTVALFPAEGMPSDPMAAPAPKAAPAAGDTTQARSASLALPLLFGGTAGALALGGGGLLWWRRRSPSPALGMNAPAVALAGPRPMPVPAALRRAAGKK